MSDLHLLPEEVTPAHHVAPGRQYQQRVGAITRAIRHCVAEKERIDVVAVTGDVIDTSGVVEDDVVAIVTHLVESIREACGPVPILLVPGNHDRRRIGQISRRSSSRRFNCETRARSPPPSDRT